jgi:alpha-tubulin suppressor-like RCC1 family protein
VVLDNGHVHYFGNGELLSSLRDLCEKEQHGSFTIKGYKIQSFALGYYHVVMVKMRGAIFGFGCNNDHQLGVVDPSIIPCGIVSMPTKVFTAITQFKGAARLPDGKERQHLGAH